MPRIGWDRQFVYLQKELKRTVEVMQKREKKGKTREAFDFFITRSLVILLLSVFNRGTPFKFP
jgi:hypothetical protein